MDGSEGQKAAGMDEEEELVGMDNWRGDRRDIERVRRDGNGKGVRDENGDGDEELGDFGRSGLSAGS